MYFKAPYTEESIKKQYRALSKRLHPDTGGNEYEFNLMKHEYDVLTKLIASQKPAIIRTPKKKKKVLKKVKASDIIKMQMKRSVYIQLQKIFNKWQ